VIGIFKRQFDSGQDITIVGDGTQRRDYVNVDDVVDANIKAAFSTDPRVVNQIFNIGSEKNYSVLDLADMITQGENEYKHLPARPGEAKETLADCTKAKELLGWSAKVNLKEWLETNR
jgi:nucleoside-diphosphate-sugar epimerase